MLDFAGAQPVTLPVTLLSLRRVDEERKGAGMIGKVALAKVPGHFTALSPPNLAY
jgi:hypothetical protein